MTRRTIARAHLASVPYCQCADIDLRGGRLIPYEDRFPLGSEPARPLHATAWRWIAPSSQSA